MAIEAMNNIHESTTTSIDQTRQAENGNRRQEVTGRTEQAQEEETRVEDRQENETTEKQLQQARTESTNILGNLIDVRV